jgi:signal transduction histidine kinase
VPYRRIEDPAKLRRLLEAVLLLEGDLTLPDLLRHLIEEACAMTGARYGALGVLDEARTSLAEFVTVGLSAEEELAIGPRPTGRGVLGLLIADPVPLRLVNISEHPQRSGFPPNHPPMTSFLGVPVTAHGEVYGNLYLTDKQGWSEFTQDDEWLAISFAQAAGVAIESARLHERVQEVAVLEDRDRIARDLHDDVIQRLFATGLALQALLKDVDTRSAERLELAIGDIDATIRRIRSAIFELVGTTSDRGIRAGVLALVRELRPLLGFDPSVSFVGPVDTSVTSETTEHLLAAVREALTNVARHSNATAASVQVAVSDGTCLLVIVDNGTGLSSPSAVPTLAGGFGIANLRRRAEKLGGQLSLEPTSGGGTSLTIQVPVVG